MVKNERLPVKRRRGRPRQNRKLWRSLVRLPEPLAKQLARAAKANGVSINGAIEAVLAAWLDPPTAEVAPETHAE
jgi:predicted HicB family RNase H-like nuclease